MQDNAIAVGSSLYVFTLEAIDDWKTGKIHDMVSFAGVEQLKDAKLVVQGRHQWKRKTPAYYVSYNFIIDC